MGNVNRGELGEEQAHEPLRGAESSAARAPSPALAPGVSQILALQRSAGNAAVTRLLAARCLVAPPDPSEQLDEESEEETEEEGEQSSASAGGPENGAEDRSMSASVGMWADHPSPTAPRGPSFQAIAGPSATSMWGALQPSPGGASRTMAAIAGPTVGSLAAIQHRNPWAFGDTSDPHPTSKAPQFDFHTSRKKGADGKDQWFAAPKLTVNAYEGDAHCLFLAAGTHLTTHKEGGLGVSWIVSAAMSALDSGAEGEHSDDFKHAFAISLKEAEDVLTKHVIGKTFGPKASEAEVKTAVTDAIAGNLTHAALGSDQSKWSDAYFKLTGKSQERDAKQWHTFQLGSRKKTAAGVTYEVNAGLTSIGVTPSSKIVTY